MEKSNLFGGQSMVVLPHMTRLGQPSHPFLVRLLHSSLSNRQNPSGRIHSLGIILIIRTLWTITISQTRQAIDIIQSFPNPFMIYMIWNHRWHLISLAHYHRSTPLFLSPLPLLYSTHSGPLIPQYSTSFSPLPPQYSAHFGPLTPQYSTSSSLLPPFTHFDSLPPQYSTLLR